MWQRFQSFWTMSWVVGMGVNRAAV
jgi:hypothetical protein